MQKFYMKYISCSKEKAKSGLAAEWGFENGDRKSYNFSTESK